MNLIRFIIIPKWVRGLSGSLLYGYLLLTAGCGKPNADHSVRIAASTTTIVTDMVKEIGGERIQVIGLMGPGVDPHLYKPTASDVTTLQKADVIFYSGLMLEGRMADLFTRMGRRGKKVYAVTEAIAEDNLLEPEAFEGHWDPHIWGDASLWAQTIDVVVEGLSAADPDGRPFYRRQGEAYRQQLWALHEWAKKRAAELPEEQRLLVTSHDAFNYFGVAYGFEVIGVQGISTVTEAGLADIAQTVDFIKARNIKSIFIESSVSPATIERISKDSGARIGGELFSDAMGIPGDREEVNGESYDKGTYLGMIKHNMNTVVEALK